MSSSEPLDRAILEAFMIALSAGRLDVAEHLLRALECLGGGPASSGVAEAYRTMLEWPECSCKRPQRADEADRLSLVAGDTEGTCD